MRAAHDLRDLLRAEVYALVDRAAPLSGAELQDRLVGIAQRNATELGQLDGEFSDEAALTFSAPNEGTLEDPIPFFRTLAANVTAAIAEKSIVSERGTPRFQEMIAAAKPPSIRVVHNDGGAFAKFHKGPVGATWAMGAPGVVRVDGEEFANANGPVLVPRSWPLRPVDPADHYTRRMTQTAFPFAYGGARPEDLAIVSAAIAKHVIRPITSKLIIMASVDSLVNRGKLARATIGQVARFVNPRPKSGRWQSRDFADVAEAFEEMDAIHVFPPDGRKIRMFEVDRIADTTKARPEIDVFYGFSRIFVDRVLASGVAGPFLDGSEYRGWFLVNVTGLMATPNERPAWMRYYLRHAAEVNAACGNLDRIEFRSLEDYALEANDLSSSVVEYLASKGLSRKSTQRAALSQAKDRIEQDFRDMAKAGMWVLEERAGKFRRLPTAAHLEAWKRMREKGGRPLALPRTPHEPTPRRDRPKPASANVEAARANLIVPAILAARGNGAKPGATSSPDEPFPLHKTPQRLPPDEG